MRRAAAVAVEVALGRPSAAATVEVRIVFRVAVAVGSSD
jgi:hypothetical protein